MINISEAVYSKKYLPLLLSADPDEKAIGNYIYRSRIFIYQMQNEIIAIAAVLKKEKNIYEIKNIAVRKDFQRMGIGKELIKTLKFIFLGKKLIVGTADTSINAQKFYKSCGFKRCGIIEDYFTNNYEKKIYENGLLCKDMILFETGNDIDI